jgi:hypothetical protein
MNERPILFSAPMVRAILAGAKTQTRRVMKPQMQVRNVADCFNSFTYPKRGGGYWLWPNAKAEILAACPYGAPGGRLWVRETWAEVVDEQLGGNAIAYRADACVDPDRWRPAIHMPRSACRIRLDIVGVRVESLQEISEADALAEGIAITGPAAHDGSAIERYMVQHHVAAPVARFAALWDSLNEERGFGFATNPQVWVVEFRRGA